MSYVRAEFRMQVPFPIRWDRGTRSTMSDVELPIATQGKRLLNLIIDNIVLQIVSRVVGVAVGAAMIRPGEVITPDKQSTLFVVAMIMVNCCGGVLLGYGESLPEDHR